MWDLDGKPASHLANYEPFVASLASHTTAFGHPVLLLNGDSHVYRSDNPLSPTAPCVTEASPGGPETLCANESANHPGYDVPNFHRITVHGSTFPLEWLKLTILWVAVALTIISAIDIVRRGWREAASAG